MNNLTARDLVQIFCQVNSNTTSIMQKFGFASAAETLFSHVLCVLLSPHLIPALPRALPAISAKKLITMHRTRFKSCSCSSSGGGAIVWLNSS